MSNRSAVRPLDPAARKAADAEIYRRHAGDPRPNPLYDESGRRQPLDPDDPSQAALCSEWMDLYESNGGRVEGGGGSSEERTTDGTSEPCPTEGPEPTIRAEWARNGSHTDYVVPDHNPSGGVSGAGAVAGVSPMQSVVEYPFEFERPDAGGGTVTHIKFVPSDECLVSPLVRVENVPDGTSARIEVYHCRTNQLVSGGTLDGLEVRSGKVVRPSTNAEPKLTFRYGQEPWHLWDKPFFYFKAYVHFRGLRVQTPADFENEGNNCLRVRYWHVCIGFTGDAIAPSVQSKCNTVKGFFDGVQHSCSTIQHFTSYNHAEAAFGSFFRNSYAVFSDSHGTLVQRSDNWTLCPNHDYSAPPNLNRGDWKSVVCFTPQPYIDAADVSNAQYFVSVPRYLYYISACLSGWEPSLANAFISRGCMHVIAYGKVIYTDKGEQMARRFFDRWTNTYHLAPDKIADAFLHAGSGLRDDLRPILYPAGTEIPSGGLSGWAIAGIVLGALAIVAVGVLVGAALLGLL